MSYQPTATSVTPYLPLTTNLTTRALHLSGLTVLSRLFPRLEERISTWAFLLGRYSEKASDRVGRRIRELIVRLLAYSKDDLEYICSGR